MNKRTRIRAAAIAVGVLFGLATGIGAYTFVYARGGSHLTNNPKACANCHIMQVQYDAWLKSSHRSVATCNDCHTPHNVVGKYWTKTDHGFWHSYAFSTGDFQWPEAEPKARVETIQGNTYRLRNLAMDPLVELIGEIKAAKTPARPTINPHPRGISSARRSSISTSSKRKTRWASMPRRKLRAFSANRLTSPGAGRRNSGNDRNDC